MARCDALSDGTSFYEKERKNVSVFPEHPFAKSGVFFVFLVWWVDQ
jgi:hypothetical protein